LAITADVVVTGIRVPGPFDGVELVRHLRTNATTQDRPIIVLTACAFTHDERRARAAGCDVFLRKPCYPEALLAEIQRVWAGGTRRATAARAMPGRRKRETA
jgi:two-component system cell cycle response regulator DivK